LNVKKNYVNVKQRAGAHLTETNPMKL
jgi:hypothetical protein